MDRRVVIRELEKERSRLRFHEKGRGFSSTFFTTEAYGAICDLNKELIPSCPTLNK